MNILSNKNNLFFETKKLVDNSATIKELEKALNEFAKLIEIDNGYHCMDYDKKLGKNTVFGEFNRNNANVMIVGEAPGKDEDLKCKPFCGKSGSLLNEMIEKIGIDRNDLCITNTIFWRPFEYKTKRVSNRVPTTKEIKICRLFLEKQIALVNPELIICLGYTSLSNFVNIESMNLARFSVFEYNNSYLNNKNISIVSTYHPFYLLRPFSKDKKKEVFEKDLLFIKDKIKKYDFY